MAHTPTPESVKEIIRAEVRLGSEAWATLADAEEGQPDLTPAMSYETCRAILSRGESGTDMLTKIAHLVLAAVNRWSGSRDDLRTVLQGVRDATAEERPVPALRWADIALDNCDDPSWVRDCMLYLLAALRQLRPRLERVAELDDTVAVVRRALVIGSTEAGYALLSGWAGSNGSPIKAVMPRTQIQGRRKTAHEAFADLIARHADPVARNGGPAVTFSALDLRDVVPLVADRYFDVVVTGSPVVLREHAGSLAFLQRTEFAKQLTIVSETAGQNGYDLPIHVGSTGLKAWSDDYHRAHKAEIPASIESAVAPSIRFATEGGIGSQDASEPWISSLFDAPASIPIATGLGVETLEPQDIRDTIQRLSGQI